jgi:hypothetical protein
VYFVYSARAHTHTHTQLVSDEGVLAAVKGVWDQNKTYAVKKEDA